MRQGKTHGTVGMTRNFHNHIPQTNPKVLFYLCKSEDPVEINAKICSISSDSLLFAKVTFRGFIIYKGYESDDKALLRTHLENI